MGSGREAAARRDDEQNGGDTDDRFGAAASYDKCHTIACYSKPLNVSVSGLSIDTRAPGALALHFENNDHNIQVLLPIEIKLGWGKA